MMTPEQTPERVITYVQDRGVKCAAEYHIGPEKY